MEPLTAANSFSMSDPPDYLRATLLALPDDRRASVERELVRIVGDGALGRLAADVAHDIANPLFGVIGLVDLLLADAEPGSQAEERLLLIRQTGLGLKDSLQDLLGRARAGDEGQPRGDLAEAARTAVRLVRRGRGKDVETSERYPGQPVVVACPAPVLVQAALHLATAARREGRLDLEVGPDGSLRVEPGRLDPVAAIAVERIAADHGGSFSGHTLKLPLVG